MNIKKLYKYNRNISRIYLFGLLVFFTIASAAGQTTAHSLLWKISGNGLKQDSYLFGTIHMIDQNDFNVRAAIDSVFELSEAVAFELKLDDYSMQQKLMDWSNLPQEKTLESYCTESEYKKLESYLKDSLASDITTFTHQKPFLLSQVFVADQIKGATASYEFYFLSKCITTNKPIFGLETIDSELEIFDIIPYEEQIDWLIESIDSSAAENIQWNALSDAYQNEDIETLANIMNGSDDGMMQHEDLFLTNRNKNWIPVIEELTAKKATFIAVGAAHLVGSNGIIALMQKEGYTVIPIMPQTKK